MYDGYLQVANNNGNLYIGDPTEPVLTCPLVHNRCAPSVFYTHDGNKNVSEIISDNGMVFAYYGYTPFGVVIVKHDTFVANPFRFVKIRSPDKVNATKGRLNAM